MACPFCLVHRSAVWRGFVFVNVSGDAEPIETQLGRIGRATGQIAVDGGATAGWSDHDVIPPPQMQNGQWVDAAAPADAAAAPPAPPAGGGP